MTASTQNKNVLGLTRFDKERRILTPDDDMVLFLCDEGMLQGLTWKAVSRPPAWLHTKPEDAQMYHERQWSLPLRSSA